MTRKLSCIILFLISSNLFAGKGNEQWIDIGFRGTANSTFLYNPNALSDKSLKYKFPFGPSAGLKIGYNFGKVVSLTVEGLYSMVDQKIGGTTLGSSWNKQVKLSYIDIPVLFRFKNVKKWKYYELGVKFGMLQSSSVMLNSTSDQLGKYSGKYSLDNMIRKDNMAIVAGFGKDMWGTKGMLLSLGLRFSYGLTDLFDTGGNNQNFPFPLFPGDLNNTSNTSYQKTNLVTAGLQLNIDYDLGTFMSSSCKRSHKFVLFGH